MPQTETMGITTPAGAFWNQRDILKGRQQRFRILESAVGWESDLFLSQWAQLYSFCLDFQPDLILELGRGKGNSTCVFTEVAHSLDKEARVLSLCLSPDWHSHTAKKIEAELGAEWFRPLEAIEADITKFDYRQALASAERVFLFWDAHGFEVAEKILGDILPQIHTRPHVVAMHDLSDTRYIPDQARLYGKRSLWKGNNWEGPRVRLGVVDSAVEQSVAITDFTGRNGVALESADHSFHTELSPDRRDQLTNLLEDDFFSTSCHWFWFTLPPEQAPFTFPHIAEEAGTRLKMKLPGRLKAAVKLLLSGDAEATHEGLTMVLRMTDIPLRTVLRPSRRKSLG